MSNEQTMGASVDNYITDFMLFHPPNSATGTKKIAKTSGKIIVFCNDYYQQTKLVLLQ